MKLQCTFVNGDNNQLDFMYTVESKGTLEIVRFLMNIVVGINNAKQLQTVDEKGGLDDFIGLIAGIDLSEKLKDFVEFFDLQITQRPKDYIDEDLLKITAIKLYLSKLYTQMIELNVLKKSQLLSLVLPPLEKGGKAVLAIHVL